MIYTSVLHLQYLQSSSRSHSRISHPRSPFVIPVVLPRRLSSALRLGRYNASLITITSHLSSNSPLASCSSVSITFDTIIVACSISFLLKLPLPQSLRLPNCFVRPNAHPRTSLRQTQPPLYHPQWYMDVFSLDGEHSRWANPSRLDQGRDVGVMSTTWHSFRSQLPDLTCLQALGKQ